MRHKIIGLALFVCSISFLAAGVAIAQEVVVEPVAGSGIDFSGIAASFKEIAITGVSLFLAWLANLAYAQWAKLTGKKTEAEETRHDLDMQDYARQAVDLLWPVAMRLTNTTEEGLKSVEIKNKVASKTLGLLVKAYPEIIDWLDDDDDGMIDWIQGAKANAHKPA